MLMLSIYMQNILVVKKALRKYDMQPTELISGAAKITFGFYIKL